ncbi:hypothetical protein [Rhizobium sp. B21/90]|uniref:hypothetical protein n=1 Tax=Rhizobium sp. B21/90 TaxID=2819993 RepID=UPI00214AA4E8|nr:hypothetical protein [Rhizobium sp. B21/90]
MRNALHAPLLAALLASVVSTSEARADDGVLPASIIASTTTGFWQDTSTVQPAPAATLPSTDASTAITPPSRHGFYKLYAVRQADRTSKVYLQQVATTDDGPQIVSTTELPEITALKAIVTDIRPENSGGIIREPGLFATLYIKADADAYADVWNVMLDELGEIVVEKAPE